MIMIIFDKVNNKDEQMLVVVLFMCVYILYVIVFFIFVFFIILKYINVYIQCVLVQGLMGCSGMQVCLYLDFFIIIIVFILEGKFCVLVVVYGYYNSLGYFVFRLVGDVLYMIVYCEFVYFF